MTGVQNNKKADMADMVEVFVKIAICDDEKIYCDRLQSLLNKHADNLKLKGFEIKEFNSGTLFLKDYSAGLFDIVFLDVDMPGLSGFETAERIREADKNVEIVFVTHMESQMHMGYRFGAKDYLIKPLVEERLAEVMERILNEHELKQEYGHYKVELKFGGSTKLPLADVLYFESQEHYIHAILTYEQHTFREQLQNVEENLKDRGFVRIHQSYLINKKHVFKDFSDHVLLQTGQKLPLSRKYKKTASEALKGAWD